eukprot:COSAG02_NODE_1778_length_10950_cov_7.595060_2_plen_86_part_00
MATAVRPVPRWTVLGGLTGCAWFLPGWAVLRNDAPRLTYVVIVSEQGLNVDELGSLEHSSTPSPRCPCKPCVQQETWPSSRMKQS